MAIYKLERMKSERNRWTVADGFTNEVLAEFGELSPGVYVIEARRPLNCGELHGVQGFVHHRAREQRREKREINAERRRARNGEWLERLHELPDMRG